MRLCHEWAGCLTFVRPPPIHMELVSYLLKVGCSRRFCPRRGVVRFRCLFRRVARIGALRWGVAGRIAGVFQPQVQLWWPRSVGLVAGPTGLFRLARERQ